MDQRFKAYLNSSPFLTVTVLRTDYFLIVVLYLGGVFICHSDARDLAQSTPLNMLYVS